MKSVISYWCYSILFHQQPLLYCAPHWNVFVSLAANVFLLKFSTAS